MKKEKQDNLLESQKIVKNLTGHFESDKKLLIRGIESLRAKNAAFEEVKMLGIALYKLLLDNGLNESDVINQDRLYNKIDGFVYNNQETTALDILTVLDAISPYEKFDGKNVRVYCFENQIEARIFEEDGVVVRDFSWLESPRPNLLATKAKIYLDMGKNTEALAAVKEILEINPVSFTAHLLEAQVYREKNPKKFKEILKRAAQYAYTPQHFVQLFQNYYHYYLTKEDYVTAYAVLSAVKIYEVNDGLLDELEALKQKMNRTVVTPFKVPSAEQIMQILEKENIEVQISVKNYAILIELYKTQFETQENKALIKKLAEYIQGFAGQEDVLKIIEKKLKNK